jgi:hypothetical protein
MPYVRDDQVNNQLSAHIKFYIYLCGRLSISYFTIKIWNLHFVHKFVLHCSLTSFQCLPNFKRKNLIFVNQHKRNVQMPISIHQF